MNVFSANTAVTLDVPLQDRNGNPLSVSGVSYRVTDQNGTELVPVTTLDGFIANAPVATIVVPAEINALAADTLMALRQVTLLCTVGANTVTLHAPYGLSVFDPLKSGVNSFMTYAQAQFVALTLTGIEGWDGADEQARIVALIEARTRILRLNFDPYGRNNTNQSVLSLIPNGSRVVRAPGVAWVGDLSLLTPEQFNQLPVDFMTALRQAQLVEANAILGGDTIDQKRRDGLVQDNIGESRQMFRSGKPLELPVARRTLGYLTGYVTYSLRTGRA